jgi:hypothetical protein|tara:strand:- start:413 stop:1402 length:990 start_codon:yes stop_codon:yes gene_type:complete
MATLPEFKGEEYKFPDEQETVVEDKFEVEIEDDTPPQDRGRKPMKEPVEDPTDEELSSYDEKVQARIKKFTRGYHDERRAKEEAQREREAAETFARQVFEENKRLQQQLSTGSKAFIEQSQSAAEIELVSAKKRYKEAYESGDVDALTEAQAEIAKATLKIDKASGMKPIEVEDRDFTASQPAQPKLDRRTQKWVDTNKDWWGKDEEMTMTAMGLDKKLQKQYGADYIGTEEYFETIDKTMRKRFPEYFEDTQSDEDDEPPPKKRTSDPVDEDTPPHRATRPSTVVAPASRSTPPNRIKLKGSEAAIARRLGVPIEEYAKQVAKLRRGE